MMFVSIQIAHVVWLFTSHMPCNRLKCCFSDEPNEEQLFSDTMQLLRKLVIEVCCCLHLCGLGATLSSLVCLSVCLFVCALLGVPPLSPWLPCAASSV